MSETTTVLDVAALPPKQSVRDLTIGEARDLLDWLESNQFHEVEVAVDESGMISVTWLDRQAAESRLWL